MEDLESLLRKLHHSGEEIFERYCIVNGSFFPLDAIEGMGIEEYFQRTLYSFPQRFYKFFPDMDSAESDTERSGQKENYSIKALESNEVYLSNPIDFDDVFDSEINVPFDEFEEFRIRTYAQWSHCQITPDMSAGEVRNIFSRQLSEVITKKESIEAIGVVSSPIPGHFPRRAISFPVRGTPSRRFASAHPLNAPRRWRRGCSFLKCFP